MQDKNLADQGQPRWRQLELPTLSLVTAFQKPMGAIMVALSPIYYTVKRWDL